MSAHLSSEQMERVLAGKADAQAMEHVSACAVCSEEMARLGVMLGAFRESVVDVAAAARSRAVVREPAPARRLGFWATVAGAVVFAAVMVPVATRHGAVAPQTPVVANAPVGPAAVSDDELMAKIQNDLASSVPAPMQALEGADDNTGSKSNTNSN